MPTKAIRRIWHIIRIEDIVVNSLIREKKEILFEDDFDKKIGADIITTGNELVKQEIAEFSKKLNIDALYDYAIAVKILLREYTLDDYEALFEIVSDAETMQHYPAPYGSPFWTAVNICDGLEILTSINTVSLIKS